MSSTHEQTHGQTHSRFSGPLAWAVCLIVGVMLGVVAGKCVPHNVQGHVPESTSEHADEPMVVQISPDGKRQSLSSDWLADADRLKIEKTVERLNATINTPGPLEYPPTDGTQAEPRTGVVVHAEPEIALWLCIPFALLLLGIAVMPFVNKHFWHARYPEVALLLGGSVGAYFLTALGSFGQHEVMHAGLEYFSFMAIAGGLYVASGGILIEVRDRGRPWSNTILLATGAVLANIVGTTGASMLLIRPFMRMNRGRMRAMHVVMFIFIVSNCGGCLTPIGDPPLYLGFLKGVPFEWTLTHMWPMWLLVNGLLLVMFFGLDTRQQRADNASGREVVHVFDPSNRTPLVTGMPAVVCLLVLVGGVFIDPLLKSRFGFEGVPVGAMFQVVMAVVAYFVTKPSIRHANQFTFEPVKEVGFLFFGIFLTMVPALAYLRGNAASIGLESPTQYYFATGLLSGVLDNAPTYLSFLQVAMGTLHIPMSPEGIRQFIASSYELTHGPGGAVLKFEGQTLLESVSLGAVFFGALTYIGNGPNFMVKSIVDSTYERSQKKEAHHAEQGLGVKMPSFFGYVLWAMVILLPVLVLNWWMFIR